MLKKSKLKFGLVVTRKNKMKNYSQLTNNRRLLESVTQDDRSRFISYAQRKANEMFESGNYAFHLSSLFEDNNYKEKLDNLISRYYPEDTVQSFDEVVDKFDEEFITTDEADQLVIESVTKFFESVFMNPTDPLSHLALSKAIRYNNELTATLLMNEAVGIAKMIDVSDSLDKALTESADAMITTDEVTLENAVPVLEALIRALIYTNHDTAGYINESIVNVLNIYKEGISLVKTNDADAIDIFKNYIRTGTDSIVYTIQQINNSVKDPGMLSLLCLGYFNTWVDFNRMRLSYKFNIDTFNRLENIYNMVKIHIGRDIMDELESMEMNFSFEKLYQTMELVQGISQSVRIDLRSGLSKYISLIRPMVDSFRLSYQRVANLDDITYN